MQNIVIILILIMLAIIAAATIIQMVLQHHKFIRLYRKINTIVELQYMKRDEEELEKSARSEKEG